MTLEERERIVGLYDLYGDLLTEKQRMFFDWYYHCDLSLGEIAAEQQISRTAVHDLIKRTEHLLEEYEAHLQLSHRQLERRMLLDQLAEICAGNETALALLERLGVEDGWRLSN